VALALVNEPEVLFLDEPTTGMDPQARRSLWGLVRGLAERGTTVLLTTHYMEEAEELCDRIAIMDHGRILEMGGVAELVGRRFHELSVRFDDQPELTDGMLRALPGVSRVMRDDGSTALYTSDVAGTIGGLLAMTSERGTEPSNLMVRRATLEDVFLDLTGRALRD
jgi:ABC-2 type transport system ATP-binding protein